MPLRGKLSFKIGWPWDFPSGPVAKTPCSQCTGLGLAILWNSAFKCGYTIIPPLSVKKDWSFLPLNGLNVLVENQLAVTVQIISGLSILFQ